MQQLCEARLFERYQQLQQKRRRGAGTRSQKPQPGSCCMFLEQRAVPPNSQIVRKRRLAMHACSSLSFSVGLCGATYGMRLLCWCSCGRLQSDIGRTHSRVYIKNLHPWIRSLRLKVNNCKSLLTCDIEPYIALFGILSFYAYF